MVILKRLEDYDIEVLKNIIRDSLDDFNIKCKLNKDSKVFIKTNCVGPFSYELGITTHPIILKATIQVIKEYTNNILVGDNPAIRDISFTMKKCGLDIVLKEENVNLFDGTIFETITNSNPKLYSTFEVSKQMIDCDLLINLPKLKTHTLAYMTCAEKNYFGLIYGLNKSGWHIKASNPLDFGNAINDLYGALLEAMINKSILNICDGIIGLEGEGPSSGGKTKKANALLISDDAVSLDRVALEVVHLDYKKLYINQIANDRGYGNGNIKTIEIKGNSLEDFDDIHFLAPKDSISHAGIRLLQWPICRALFLEHPIINKNKCVGCRECTKICPPKTLKVRKGKYPSLKTLKCIRCWCCAEVCPQNAIEKSKRPLLGKVLFKTDKK